MKATHRNMITLRQQFPNDTIEMYCHQYHGAIYSGFSGDYFNYLLDEEITCPECGEVMVLGRNLQIIDGVISSGYNIHIVNNNGIVLVNKEN